MAVKMHNVCVLCSQEWEAKANKDKERYADEMKTFKSSGSNDVDDDVEGSSGTKRKKESPTKKATPNSTMTGQDGFKSKEYISDDGSTDAEKSDREVKKSKASKSAGGDKKSKSSKKSSDEEEEEEEEDEESSIGDDSD